MTRTCDLLVRSQTLYPTELRARAVRLFELTTASTSSPIRHWILKLRSAGACARAALMVRHALACIATHPARVDPVRHPYAGVASGGDFRAKELLHRLGVRAADENLPGIFRVLP